MGVAKMIDLFDMDDNKKEEDIEQQELETLEVEDESPEEFPLEENIITQEDCANDAVCLEDDDFLTRRISEMDDENKEKEINCNFSYLQEEDNSRSEGFNFDSKNNILIFTGKSVPEYFRGIKPK